QIGRDGIVQRLDEHRLGFVQAEAAQRDLGGGNGGGQAVGRSGDLRRFAARPFKVFERHPPLLLSPFPGPLTGLFTGRFPRRLFDRLFQEPPRFPPRRFLHPASSSRARVSTVASSASSARSASGTARSAMSSTSAAIPSRRAMASP